MKTPLVILFLLTSTNSYGQACDTIKGRVINCVDNNGQKQGLWEYGVFEWRQKENDGPVPGFCQTAPLVRTRIGVTATGNYRDNMKEGTWKYFDNYSPFSIKRVVSFNDNGTITERNFKYGSVIEFSNDSSSITGYVIHNGDTINVFCLNKKGIFKLDNDKVVLTFDCPDFNKFDFELSRLIYDVYDREIKLTKLNYRAK